MKALPGYLLSGLGFGVIAACGGCWGFYAEPDSTRPLNVRIENGTAQYLEVQVKVSVRESAAAPASSAAADEPSAGRDVAVFDESDFLVSAEPPAEQSVPADADSNGVASSPDVVTIGLRPAESGKSDLGLTSAVAGFAEFADDRVRVSPREHTDGQVACGDLISIAVTTVGGAAGAVVLEGDGSGTLGFDEGSVGPSGERLLLERRHYACGDTILVRVLDSGLAEDEAVAFGTVQVISAAEPLPPPGVGGSPAPEAGDDRIEVRVLNSTPSYAQLRIWTTVSESDINGADDEEGTVDPPNGIDVRVPPGLLSTGLFDCVPQMLLAGTVVVPGVAVGEADDFNHVVMSGEGTGTVGFDQNSVGVTGQRRLLLEGVHFNCGQIIAVEFTSDGNPDTSNETLGSAVISVTD